MKHPFAMTSEELQSVSMREISTDEVSQVSGGCPTYTTLRVGEEGGDPVTTMAIGEEGGDLTTMALGEEGGIEM